MAYTINHGQSAPYVYQEYPRRMYKWDAKPCSVTSDDERAEKEAAGWSIEQVFAPPVVSDAPLVEVQEVPDPVDDDAPRRRPKKGRG